MPKEEKKVLDIFREILRTKGKCDAAKKIGYRYKQPPFQRGFVMLGLPKSGKSSLIDTILQAIGSNIKGQKDLKSKKYLLGHQSCQFEDENELFFWEVLPIASSSSLAASLPYVEKPNVACLVFDCDDPAASTRYVLNQTLQLNSSSMKILFLISKPEKFRKIEQIKSRTLCNFLIWTAVLHGTGLLSVKSAALTIHSEAQKNRLQTFFYNNYFASNLTLSELKNEIEIQDSLLVAPGTLSLTDLSYPPGIKPEEISKFISSSAKKQESHWLKVLSKYYPMLSEQEEKMNERETKRLQIPENFQLDESLRTLYEKKLAMVNQLERELLASHQ
eukprot:snap_masked-scaffold_15-processed-gene-2.33-mRNA-1 protein AED:1.00 eAED:1.00 QI:0/-1/0/0/-1/1/1/0/331